MKKGFIAIVLHSHLPFVRHPEEEYFLEENWLYEAITESYLPLLDVFYRLEKEEVDFRINMSITPPLMNMLKDHLLMERYNRYLKNRIEMIDLLITEESNADVRRVYEFYKERYLHLYDILSNILGFYILKGFRYFFERGNLEIITCTATHEILPLEQNYKIREAQVKIGVQTFMKNFGKKPRGIWLGECAFTPGIGKILLEHGIEFTILDTHGVLFAEPAPLFGINAPIVSREGVVFFGRDPSVSKQVWSAKEGYPGDYDYREFYKDIGYDIDDTKVKKYLHPAGFRHDSGIKIHKITGKVDLKDKQLYDPEKAFRKAEEHAGNFMFNCEEEAKYLYNIYKNTPVLVAPFDTELFGHWWFEGPEFLYFFLKKVSQYSRFIEATTLSSYIDRFPVMQVAEPNVSTWGDGGYFKVWLNDKTDWIYPHLNVAGKRMIELANKFDNPTRIQERVLNQMARELLLAESSDWAFLITVGTAVDYATERETMHINSFNLLYDNLQSGEVNVKLLKYLEAKDNIFPDINYRLFKEAK